MKPKTRSLAFLVDASEHNLRADVCLQARTNLSRTRIQTLIKEGAARLTRNGEAQDFRSPSLKLHHGDRLRLALPAATPDDAPPPHPMPQVQVLTIVEEDEHLLVLNKPAGLVVHPAPGHSEGTLVHALLAHCGEALSQIGGAHRRGIVHRLDKDTSGLMVVAKTDAAHRALSQQFAAHGSATKLARHYDALVWGALHPPRGIIDAPLGRHAKSRQKQAVQKTGGRAARTHYEERRRWCAPKKSNAKSNVLVSRLRCRLETGRTHQLRVHLAHKGHSVLGDARYGARQTTKARRLPPPVQASLAALARQALHAHALAFVHPASGKTLRFSAPPPPRMRAVIAALNATLATA